MEERKGSISASSLACNSPEIERVDRKRSRASNKKETDTSTARESKKRKSQSSSRKSHVQSKKNKSAEETTNQEQSTSSNSSAQTTNKHVNGQSSASESDGNSNSSEKRDSLILSDAHECQSDRNFLHEQIKLLRTPFQFEEECPALAKIKANDSKHIPVEVIQNTMRKVNHKTEDEILRSLNRQTQRKVLRDLRGAMHERHQTKATIVSDELLLERHKEIQIRVAKLEKTHDEIKQQHTQHKNIGVLVSQLEAISEEFTSKKLTEEVKRMSSSGPLGGSSILSNYTPSAHQELVNILFKD